jgi:serine/threonine protein kinase
MRLAHIKKGVSLMTAGPTAGTPTYMAPECLKGQISLSNDVWSIGIVLIELLTAASAWGSVTDLFHLYSLFQSQAMPSGFALVSEQYQNIIRFCLVYEPEK